MELLDKPANKEYVLAISCFDYLRAKSGVPRVMLSHQEMFLKHGISYVGLFPVKKTLCHDRLLLFCMYGLIIDGNYIGVFQMNQIISILLDWNSDNFRMINIHLHHLMYMNWKTVGALVNSFSNVPIKIYLHDYYLACLNHFLLDENGRYCGGKGLNFSTCKNCRKYQVSKKHTLKVKSFFSKCFDRCLFISPSETTKDIFCRFYPEWGNKIVVIPHQRYQSHFRKNLELIEKDEPINVAFLGKTLYHKGWKTWRKIVEATSQYNYKFFVFNSSEETYEKLNMNKVKIEFSKDDLNVMTNALRGNKIHVVVLWSICPETYSYTYNEAYSANAFIVTNKVSGNIQDSVLKNDNGIVLENEQELIKLFKEKEKLRGLINEFRIRTPGGPDVLQENEEIVRIVNQEKNFGVMRIKPYPKGISNITNKPFLWLLNKIY